MTTDPTNPADHPESGESRGGLVHLCPADDWAAVSEDGELAPASLSDQGFVHLSYRDQVHIPATALYARRSDLLLLHVDENALTGEVRVEAADPPREDGMQFPHLYGPLPRRAVTSVERYTPADDGTFAPPD